MSSQATPPFPRGSRPFGCYRSTTSTSWAPARRDRLIPKGVRDQIAAHGRGRYEGPAGVRLLMIDGVAAGLWERKKRGKRIELRVIPARKLTRAQREELNDEVERIGAFTSLEPVLTLE
jgi:winged helix DNA-binding protein